MWFVVGCLMLAIGLSSLYLLGRWSQVSIANIWTNLLFSQVGLKLWSLSWKLPSNIPQGCITMPVSVLRFYCIFIYLFYVYVCPPGCACGNQGTTCWSCFSPATIEARHKHSFLHNEPSHWLLCCNIFKIIFILSVWVFCPCAWIAPFVFSAQSPEVDTGSLYLELQLWTTIWV